MSTRPRLDVAGIVTYNPDLERLAANLASVTSQVSRTLIFDNGSANLREIEELICRMDCVDLEAHPTNAGIAFALNRLAEKARTLAAQWILLLDQDSVAAPRMLAELKAAIDGDTAVVTPFIVDRNKMSVPEYHNLTLPPVQYFRRAAGKGAITSGSLVNLNALAEVGGFDEQLFIDYVDYDFNQRILLAGHRIARVNSTYLLHEVGKAHPTWLYLPRKTLDGGWAVERFYSFGHSAERCYYKARNRVLFTRKFWGRIGLTNEGAVQIPQQIFLTLLFERDRLRKLHAFFRGTLDGLRMPMGEGTEAL